MKLMDKLKNALFEEEYVEIEEKPKKVKEHKPKKEENKVKITNYDEEKPIAKKIVDDTKDKKEEKPKKEDFSFPAVDDSFFDDIDSKVEQRKKEEEKVREEKKNYTEYSKPEVEKKEETMLYKTSKEEEYVKKFTSNEYGYSKPKEKKIFRPSPNISPVYGIIDDEGSSISEQHKQREVVLTSAVRNDKINVDDVRRKAFGRDTEIEHHDAIEDTISNVAIDLVNDDVVKVDKVTMGDAEEYFEDLGLEYNNDYIDVKKEKATGRRIKEDEVVESPRVEVEENNEIEDNSNLDEEKEEVISTESESVDNDNLFDLIDSMYDN